MKIGLYLSNTSGENSLVAIDLPSIDAEGLLLDGKTKTALAQPILVTHVDIELLAEDYKPEGGEG